MTENEAIERLQTLNIILTDKAGHEEDGIEKIFTFSDITAICTAIQALEEIQQYRAIGTIEEFKALKEKNEPIANGEWIDTQPGYNNGYYKNVRVCSNCHDYYTTEYDEMKFCPKCGAKMKEQD